MPKIMKIPKIYPISSFTKRGVSEFVPKNIWGIEINEINKNLIKTPILDIQKRILKII